MGSVVYAVLGAGVDLIHALLMVVWVGGLPLLLVWRYPRLQRAYAVYAIVFVVASRLSMAVLDECFLTALVRPLWRHAGARADREWFTVRAANAVFGMAPSHHAISVVSEILVVVTAVGVLASLRHAHAAGRTSKTTSSHA